MNASGWNRPLLWLYKNTHVCAHKDIQIHTHTPGMRLSAFPKSDFAAVSYVISSFCGTFITTLPAAMSHAAAHPRSPPPAAVTATAASGLPPAPPSSPLVVLLVLLLVLSALQLPPNTAGVTCETAPCSMAHLYSKQCTNTNSTQQ